MKICEIIAGSKRGRNNGNRTTTTENKRLRKRTVTFTIILHKSLVVIHIKKIKEDIFSEYLFSVFYSVVFQLAFYTN